MFGIYATSEHILHYYIFCRILSLLDMCMCLGGLQAGIHTGNAELCPEAIGQILFQYLNV